MTTTSTVNHLIRTNETHCCSSQARSSLTSQSKRTAGQNALLLDN